MLSTENKIPRVATCCFCFDMNAGGTLLSAFGVVTGLAYISRALYVLFSVPGFEKQLDDDDALDNKDDYIWKVYISTLFCGFFFLITSLFMLYGSTKNIFLQRESHHVYPFLIGILLSIFWSIVLGTIEVFDSDMGIASAYYFFAFLQFYFWICAVSLYRDLLELELDPNKPTRTTV